MVRSTYQENEWYSLSDCLLIGNKYQCLCRCETSSGCLFKELNTIQWIVMQNKMTVVCIASNTHCLHVSHPTAIAFITISKHQDQCFKYRILVIYRSAKLYILYRISGDISRNGIKYRTPFRTSYRMKNIHVITYINHMKLLKVSLGL